MRRQQEKDALDNSSPVWGVIGGVLALAAWGCVALTRGGFWGGNIISGFLGIAFAALLIFIFSYVPFALAGGKRPWLDRFLYLLAGVGINAGLIWKIFF